MTSKKKQEWEENLPNREKYLRINMRVLRASIKEEKLALKYVDNDEKNKIKKCINAQNVIIRAMKHELERGKVTKVKRNVAGVFYCSNCCQFLMRYDNYCSTCGRKLRWGEYYGQ